MKKLTLIAIISGLALGVHAGDWGKAPVPDKTPIEECVDVGGTITTGYSTDFIFQGSRHGRDAVWTDVNYTFDSLAVPITLGATYYNMTSGGFENLVFDDFLHLYGKVGLGTFAGFDAALLLHHVFLPEGTGPAGGVAATSQSVVTGLLTRDLGFATLSLQSNYSIGGDGSIVGVAGGGAIQDDFSGGWYHAAGLSKSFALTDAASLQLAAEIGYSDNYWVHYWNDSWAHYSVTASLPIQLNCRATLTPYIGFNGGMDDNIFGRESSDSLLNAGGGDVLHGGINLSVSF